MSVFGYFLASKNIKIFSFEMLLWTALILIAIFPKLLFSLGFYLSLVGVFYIFLFVKFIKMDNKILNLFYLSVFLYLAMSPFGFYFFKQASLYQLFSPLLSLLATFFLPLSIVLHIFKFGWILDPLLSVFFAIKQDLFYVEINNFTFVTLLIFSFLATLKKEFFYAFIFCLIGFQIFIFTF